jgi:hypothetical protein
MLTRLASDDLTHVVDSVVPGQRYPCPTVEALDGHLRYLRTAVRIALDPQSRQWCRTDIDRLLDRRLSLTSDATAAESV